VLNYFFQKLWVEKWPSVGEQAAMTQNDENHRKQSQSVQDSHVISRVWLIQFFQICAGGEGHQYLHSCAYLYKNGLY